MPMVNKTQVDSIRQVAAADEVNCGKATTPTFFIFFLSEFSSMAGKGNADHEIDPLLNDEKEQSSYRARKSDRYIKS